MICVVLRHFTYTYHIIFLLNISIEKPNGYFPPVLRILGDVKATIVIQASCCRQNMRIGWRTSFVVSISAAGGEISQYKLLRCWEARWRASLVLVKIMWPSSFGRRAIIRYAWTSKISMSRSLSRLPPCLFALRLLRLLSPISRDCKKYKPTHSGVPP